MEKIPFLSFEYQHNQIHKELLNSINRVLNKNWFILGDELAQFELEFARYTGVNYCRGVGNGLDALTLALLACHISTGDEVIVPAHTYIATWLAVSRTGAAIVPVEPDLHTYNIDVNLVEAAITPKTKAIIAVHLYGQPCDMSALDQLASKYNLFLIEDNAQAHGAKWLQKLTGSFGIIGATSFYPTKNLGAFGDAGAITTNDLSKAEFVTRFRNYGLEDKYSGTELGLNSRLDELQAAVLKTKLQYLEGNNQQRQQIAKTYLRLLHNVGDVVLPLSDKKAFHVYHLFVIRTTRRDALKMFLKDNGIETMTHYPIPPHLQKAYVQLGFKEGDFPITEEIADTCLSLPIWPGLKTTQVEIICDRIKDFFD